MTTSINRQAQIIKICLEIKQNKQKVTYLVDGNKSEESSETILEAYLILQ